MKEKFIFVLFTVLFFLNSQFNIFHLIPHDKFEYSKFEKSEVLIIGKLLNSQHGSILDDGGFTGVYLYEKMTLDTAREKIFSKYLNNENPPKYHYAPYLSQIGGQAILYSLFDRVSGFDNQTSITILRSLNSFLLSLVLTFFLIWVKRKFGIFTAIVSFVFLSLNYWLFLYGKSTWWCTWVYLIPFVHGLFFFEKNTSLNFKKYIFVCSILFFIKFWFTGFEFVTVFLICSSIPYIYYLFENKFSFYILFIKRYFIITIIPLVLSILFQLYQFTLLTGNFKNGITHIISSYRKRSSESYAYEKDFTYLNHLKKYHLDIITRYLGGSFINEDLTFIKIPFLALIIIGVLCSVILFMKNIERRLVITTWFSISAPLSWFILFKQHAHIHIHIDFIIWYYPFLILIMLLISLTFNLFLKKIK